MYQCETNYELPTFIRLRGGALRRATALDEVSLHVRLLFSASASRDFYIDSTAVDLDLDLPHNGHVLLYKPHDMSPLSRRLVIVTRHLEAGPSSSAGAYKQVDDLFKEFFKTGVTPGLAYGVVVGNKLVHTGGFGTLQVGKDIPPRPDSVFRIASMTKSFIAATVLKLRDEGTLRLDDLAERWVPELRALPSATTDSPPPTLRQLLSMNAGLPEDDPWADRLEAMPDEELSALLSQPKTWSFAPVWTRN